MKSQGLSRVYCGVHRELSGLAVRKSARQACLTLKIWQKITLRLFLTMVKFGALKCLSRKFSFSLILYDNLVALELLKTLLTFFFFFFIFNFQKLFPFYLTFTACLSVEGIIASVLGILRTQYF